MIMQSEGTGQELPRQAAQAGYTVLAACKTPCKATELQQLVKEHPGQLHLLAQDVTKENSIEVSLLLCAGCSHKRGIQGPSWWDFPPDAA